MRLSNPAFGTIFIVPTLQCLASVSSCYALQVTPRAQPTPLLAIDRDTAVAYPWRPSANGGNPLFVLFPALYLSDLSATVIKAHHTPICLAGRLEESCPGVANIPRYLANRKGGK